MESYNLKSQDKEDLNKKMNFENLKDDREAFFKESEEFSGKEVEVTFKLDYDGDLNGKEFSDTFKEGQDFEFVKYKLSQILEVNQEQIDLFHNDKIIIPVYSICDIDLKPDDKIIVKIKDE